MSCGPRSTPCEDRGGPTAQPEGPRGRPVDPPWFCTCGHGQAPKGWGESRSPPEGWGQTEGWTGLTNPNASSARWEQGVSWYLGCHCRRKDVAPKWLSLAGAFAISNLPLHFLTQRQRSSPKHLGGMCPAPLSSGNKTGRCLVAFLSSLLALCVVRAELEQGEKAARGSVTRWVAKGLRGTGGRGPGGYETLRVTVQVLSSAGRCDSTVRERGEAPAVAAVL